MTEAHADLLAKMNQVIRLIRDWVPGHTATAEAVDVLRDAIAAITAQQARVQELEAALRDAQAHRGALTFAEFGIVNRQRCESPEGFNHQLTAWSTSDWFTAILGELGEAANVAKKLNRYRDGIPGNKESEAALQDKLRKELGDVFVYLDLLCQLHGFNIGDAAVEVFNAKSDEIGCSIRIDAPAPDAAPGDV